MEVNQVMDMLTHSIEAGSNNDTSRYFPLFPVCERKHNFTFKDIDTWQSHLTGSGDPSGYGRKRPPVIAAAATESSSSNSRVQHE